MKNYHKGKCMLLVNTSNVNDIKTKAETFHQNKTVKICSNVSILKQKHSYLVQMFWYQNKNIRFSPNVPISKQIHSDLVQMFYIETEMIRFSPDDSKSKQKKIWI